MFIDFLFPVYLNNVTVLCGLAGIAFLLVALAFGARLYVLHRSGRRRRWVQWAFGVSAAMVLVSFALAPFLPGWLQPLVVEPSGALRPVPLVTTPDCDGVLRGVLWSDYGRDITPYRVELLIGRIQSQHSIACAPEVWDPAPVPSGTNRCAGPVPGAVFDPELESSSVVPDSLYQLSLNPHAGGVLDAYDRNLIVEFLPDRRPHDGSLCWMFFWNTEDWFIVDQWPGY